MSKPTDTIISYRLIFERKQYSSVNANAIQQHVSDLLCKSDFIWVSEPVVDTKTPKVEFVVYELVGRNSSAISSLQRRPELKVIGIHVSPRWAGSENMYKIYASDIGATDTRPKKTDLAKLNWGLICRDEERPRATSELLP